MSDDIYIYNGKAYTRTTQRRRQIKLKEWGSNESIFRKTVGSSGEIVYPDQVFFIDTDEFACIDNENGIRSDERIAVLSGSYVESMFMDPKERPVSTMERVLNDMLKHTSNPQVQVMNCTMSGTHLLHALFVLLAKVIPLNVKTVVYVVDINDYRASTMSDGGYYTKHKNLSIFTNAKEDPEKQKPDYLYFKKFLRDFYSICKIHGMRCIFVGRTFANDDGRITINWVAKKICESMKCDYFDLSESIRNLLQSRGEDLSTDEKFNECMYGLTYDSTHLTPGGAGLVGEALAIELYNLLYKQ